MAKKENAKIKIQLIKSLIGSSKDQVKVATALGLRKLNQVVGVEADGKYGQLTKDAVIEYQKAHGLVPDGVVGINTWKVILGVK